MKIIQALAITLGLTGLTFTCLAQEEEASERYTYATYFYCGGGPLARVDEIVKEDALVMDKLVADGTILGWGWLGHSIGGQWQRLQYHQSDSLDGLLDSADAIQAAMALRDEAKEAAEGDKEGDAADEPLRFGQICTRHDDYLWQVENGSASDERGEAGFSVYHVCDPNREERADEIVAEHFAPIFNKLVEDGKLTSWGWSSHVVGGKFRKLQTMTGTDHKSLLKARGETIDLLYAEDSEAGIEFTDICGPHVDYMWDIIHESR